MKIIITLFTCCIILQLLERNKSVCRILKYCDEYKIQIIIPNLCY